MRRLIGVVVAVLVSALGLPAAHAESGWSPPVDAPVVEHFRPPATPYGPGNRGIDYASTPGDPVRASVDGAVVFAGRVGSSLHVVVLLDNGLRTTYSFLQDIAVRRGARVARGDVVGHAGGDLHFSVRAGDDYLDPEPMLAGAPPDVHLVEPVDHHSSLFGEVAGIVSGLGGHVIRAGADGITFAAGAATWTVRAIADEVVVVEEIGTELVALPYDEWRRWQRHRLFDASQRACTPPATPPPDAPGAGHVAVLVGGLGSRTGGAAILDVAHEDLGYADADIVQFSYAGGTTPYTAADSEGDLDLAARRLRAFLDDVGRSHPGMPVDVIAHSQGGLVARSALEQPDPARPPVDHLVTIGSPNHGAVLATAAKTLGRSVTGTAVDQLLDRAGAHATSPAVADLAEDSSFIAALNAGHLAPSVRFTSIGGSSDLIVPALQTPVPGATNVLVDTGGIADAVRAHDRLPANSRREIALALGDRAPTCHDVTPGLRLSLGVTTAEHALGIGLSDVAAGVDLGAVAASG